MADGAVHGDASMRVLFGDLTVEQADTCGLILSSSGIAYRVRQGRRGWQIWVEESAYESALNSVKQYFQENPEISPDPSPTYHRTFSGLWAALILLAWHMTFLRGADARLYLESYGSIPEAVLAGEIFRTVTALMLHVDGVHLIGNMVGIAVFATGVCSLIGWGTGWLMILLTGIVGNLINAAVLKTGHVSVGASTAIFGAVGILAGRQFLAHFRVRQRRMKAWLPLAGGLALLGVLGSGTHADLTAHLFGFLSGLLMGLLYTHGVRQPVSRAGQIGAMSLVVTILCVSWLTAFSHGLIRHP